MKFAGQDSVEEQILFLKTAILGDRDDFGAKQRRRGSRPTSETITTAEIQTHRDDIAQNVGTSFNHGRNFKYRKLSPSPQFLKKL